MPGKLEIFTQLHNKKALPDIRPGDVVKVYQKVPANLFVKGRKDRTAGREKKEKTQRFEGLVIARKHGREAGATITVRKIIAGVGVEKIFPLHSPNIEKIEIDKRAKIRRAKLYYIRESKGKRARLKYKDKPAARADVAEQVYAQD